MSKPVYGDPWVDLFADGLAIHVELLAMEGHKKNQNIAKNITEARINRLIDSMDAAMLVLNKWKAARVRQSPIRRGELASV